VITKDDQERVLASNKIKRKGKNKKTQKDSYGGKRERVKNDFLEAPKGEARRVRQQMFGNGSRGN